MNEEEFLQALSLTPRNWIKRSYIRDEEGWCPLLSVARGRASKEEREKKLSSNSNILNAGCSLDMEPLLAIEISIAADGRGVPELRKKLLIACGLGWTNEGGTNK